jgi:serine/threonine protein kinase
MNLAGKKYNFQTGDRIASGGFGDVYRGTLIETGATVAIKLPRATLPQPEVAVFLREAEIAARVHSPRAVRVLDWGDAPPFIAMEFIDAPTFYELIHDRKTKNSPWPEPDLVSMAIDLAQALKDVNEIVVHRDVSPRNVFLVDGAVKIADFGLSKHIDESTRTITLKEAGTPEYVSPERIAGARADHRSDQYSLGIVLYELATLSRPFSGSDSEILAHQLYTIAPRLAEHTPPFSEGFSTVVARMMAKQPDDRYQSWDGVIAALATANSRASGPPNGGVAAEIAREAAQQQDALKAAALRAQKAEDERNSLLQDRDRLLAYWITDLHARTERVVKSINEHGNQTALLLTPISRPKTEQQHHFEIQFLDKEIKIALAALPLTAPDEILLWGGGLLETHGQIWLTNLLVTKEPIPYGRLLEVDLQVLMGASYPQGTRFDTKGGNYLRRGDYALALNDVAMVYQYQNKNVMKTIQWREHPCEFDDMITNAIRALVKHAATPKPPPPPPRRRRGPFGDDDPYDDQW